LQHRLCLAHCEPSGRADWQVHSYSGQGDPAKVISLCADGVKKTGPKTFVVERENYTPTKDLEIRIVR